MELHAFGIKPIQAPPIMLIGHDKMRVPHNLTLGEPKLSEFPYELLDKLKQVEKINNYYPSLGDAELRLKIIDKYYKGLTLKNIAITHGAIGALDVILRSKLDSHSEILIPNPGFPPYEKLAQFTGAKILKYNINLHKSETMIDWESIHKKITDSTKLILLNSPHNPSGKLFTDSDMHFLRLLLIYYPNLTFIMDEVYRDLIYSKASHCDMTRFLERGYIINSFSKIYPMQGARIGWVVASEDNILEMSTYCNNAYGAISSFGQELAKLLIAQNTNYCQRYEEAKNEACSILDQYGVSYVIPDGAFFIFINYRHADEDVVRELEELGVLVVAGSAFGVNAKGFVRLSFAQANEVLSESFHIVGKHWKQKSSETLLC